MAGLEKVERYIIAVLVLSLLAGAGISAYRLSRRPVVPRIEKFRFEGAAAGMAVRKVNINTAGPEELMLLKGVGKVIASRIVDHRVSHGAFTSPEELKDVDGVGDALFGKIRDRITVE